MFRVSAKTLTPATVQFIFARMASLEGASIDVKKIADDSYRVTIESETMVFKVDLSTIDLVYLCNDALEEIAENEAEFDACSLCGDGGVRRDSGGCEVVALAATIRGMLKAHKHVGA